MACSAWLDELGPDEQPAAARLSAPANADSAMSAGLRLIRDPRKFPRLVCGKNTRCPERLHVPG